MDAMLNWSQASVQMIASEEDDEDDAVHDRVLKNVLCQGLAGLGLRLAFNALPSTFYFLL